MLKSITDKLRAISANILLLDDTPTDKEIEEKKRLKTQQVSQSTGLGQGQEQTSTKPTQHALPGQHRNVQDTPERDIKESKRPHIKAPRREPSYKTKWKGEGAKDVRNEYQREYRMNNGDK